MAPSDALSDAPSDRAFPHSQAIPPDLASLTLSHPTLEALCGLDINDIFVGGFPLGTFRPSLARSPNRLASFCITQVLALGLFAMFSVPVGLLADRDHPAQADNIHTSPFPWVVLGGTIAGLGLWNGWMLSQSRKFRTLNRLLDEVDRYQDVLAVLALYDQLQALQTQSVGVPGTEPTVGKDPEGDRLSADLAIRLVGTELDRDSVLNALGLTRNSLITALQIEKLTRHHQRLLDRRPELVSQLATNLSALTAFQVNQQAQESAQILAEVLEIGQVLRQTFAER
jgi:hypothetical protein